MQNLSEFLPSPNTQDIEMIGMAEKALYRAHSEIISKEDSLIMQSLKVFGKQEKII